jgi:hypothetical protein
VVDTHNIVRPAYEYDYPEEAVATAECSMPPAHKRNPEGKTVIAQQYIQGIIPGVRTELLSDNGNSSLVLHDGRKAYKIFRKQPAKYSDVESEVAILTVLHREGIAVRPVALIDAAPEYRQNQGNTRTMFKGRESIARVDSSGNLPVIVTELIDEAPIEEMPEELLIEQFDKFLQVIEKHDLLLRDCEIVYDQRNRQAVIIDVGGVSHLRYLFTDATDPGNNPELHLPFYNTEDACRLRQVNELRTQSPHLTDEQILYAVGVEDLLRRFTSVFSLRQIDIPGIARLIENKGMEGVHAHLLKRRREV